MTIARWWSWRIREDEATGHPVIGPSGDLTKLSLPVILKDTAE